MRHITLAVTLMVLWGAGHGASAVTYSVTDLGTLGGSVSHAFDVNNHGQVVGESTTVTGETRAFLYDNGIMTNLGVLEPAHNTSQAFGVNDSGSVVGTSFTKLANGDDVQWRPFVSSGGVMTTVGSLGGNYGVATDVNNAGQIVGISADANGVTHAFLRTSGTMLDLGSFGATYPYSIAYGINAIGSVTGYSTTGPSSSDAFIFDGGGGLSDIGNLGGSSRGFAINNSNNVTGASIIDDSGHERAFLWHDGTLSNLGITAGAVTSQGSDINNLGEIVGTLVFDSSDGELNHGFFYRNGTMIDVNSLLPQNSGWVLRDAQAINDHEQIVGFGIFHGQEHAYLLAPLPGDFDRDGTVDGRDYVIWRHNLGHVVSPCTGGDANCNGFVEWADYGPWRENWGRTAGGDSMVSGNSAAPEPTTPSLGIAACSLAWSFSRTRKMPR